MWTIELYIRYCDIFKGFRVEILAIYCRYMQSGFATASLEVSRFVTISFIGSDGLSGIRFKLLLAIHLNFMVLIISLNSCRIMSKVSFLLVHVIIITTDGDF